MCPKWEIRSYWHCACLWVLLWSFGLGWDVTHFINGGQWTPQGGCFSEIKAPTGSDVREQCQQHPSEGCRRIRHSEEPDCFWRSKKRWICQFFALYGKLNFKSWLSQRAAYGSTTAVWNPLALYTGTLTNAIVLPLLDDTVNPSPYSALAYTGIKVPLTLYTTT